MIEKFARALTRRPKLVLLIALLALIPALFGFISTRVNYDILTYLPDDLSSTQGMDLLEEPFHMAATSMLIVEDMPAGYTNELINEIKEVPGVSNALWLSNLVGVQLPTDMIPAEFRDIFFSGEGTMMIIQYDKAGASDETLTAIENVRRLCNEKCFLAGFSVVIKDTMDLVNRELPLFIALAVAMTLVAMLLTLESTVLPLILLANIAFAVAYNFGSNVLMGEISYITQAIAAVLQLGVTMDYSIFLYHRYEEEREHYDDHRDAMAQAVIAAFRSLTGSSLTTIAGFLALCAMRLTLGRDIGIVMAKGVFLGVATVILVMPALVLLADGPLHRHRHRTLLPSFDRINRWTLKHRRILAIAALLLFIPALYAQKHTDIYYKLDETLPKTMPSSIANSKLKEEFKMSSSHFILLSDDISATDMNDMETQINDVPGVSSLISYHSLLGTGIPDFFIPEDVRAMLKQGGYQMLMVNSEYETASDEVGAQIDRIKEILSAYDPDAIITGEAVMTNDLIDVTAVDFKVTNYLSIAAIFLIVTVVFKSLTVPVILVAAIELAIIANEGIAYFTGAPVAFVTPTVISAVQLGATVDYAILMTTRFQEELSSGKDRLEAARIAANTSDGSIITSALVMFCATMGVSLVTSISLIGDICTMLARGAVISALVSIFILPALLCICEPIINKTSLHWRKPSGKEQSENTLLSK